MPIREGEKFCTYFLGDTESEANELLKMFDNDLTMLSTKISDLTGADRFDLKQEGIIGLARARREFEEGRGAAFRTLALYKIKDAMREWVTKSCGMRVGQYLKDAAKLIETLQKTLEKATHLPACLSYVDIWNIANAYQEHEFIGAELVALKGSIKNLADRSHTSPVELLERAEMTPCVVDTAVIELSDETAEEKDVVDHIMAKSAVSEIKKLLTPDEFELLYDRYILGKTERELEQEMGIRAASIDVRLKNIFAKIERNQKRIPGYEKAKIKRSAGESGEDE